MNRSSIMGLTTFLVGALFIVAGTCFAQEDDPNVFKVQKLPGKYTACFVGNTFHGGGNNGFGDWVQNGADEIEVAPNGLVVAGCGWDEAGRCAGLYRDGKPNNVLLKQEDVHETAWGWNTANNAISIYGSDVYIANTGKRLLVFSGDPEDFDSFTIQREAKLIDDPLSLNVNGTYVAVGYKNSFSLISPKTLKAIARCSVGKDSELRDLLLSDDNAIWAIVDNKITRYTYANGKFFIHPVDEFESLEKPTAISFDAVDRSMLIVCDDGQDRQVKFYDVSNPAKPKLVKTFGEKGGLFSKTLVDGKPLPDGAEYPTRFFGLHGAGTDLKGNLYVSLGFNGSPIGTLTLRAFDPAGKMTWELISLAFVDTFGFDVDTDGKRIYTRTSILEVDPDSKDPSMNWKRIATTVDDQRYSEEEDPRYSTHATAYIKTLQGRKLLYTIGQYGCGYNFYTFDEKNGSMIARPAGKIRSKDETWAWHMDSKGDVWHGDYHENKTIRRYRFKGWEKDASEKDFELYKPVYDMVGFDEWAYPEDFDDIRRIIYDDKNDVLYIIGYLKTDEVDSWGVAGKTMRRYNNWLTNPTIAWTVPAPVNPTGEFGKPLTPEGIALAGDYLFIGMCKPDADRQRTYAMETKTGKLVGAFEPTEDIGFNASWQDMPYSVAAMQRKDGTYLIMVEEDWRGKNIVYRWDPNAK